MLNPLAWPAPLQDAVALLFGYLCGSIPFGLLLTRLSGGPDIRTVGSGNIGATNVLRTGRKGIAAATLVGDTLKGTVAVLIASLVSHDAAIAAGLGAFLGHLFPVWLGFRGGKGVATFIGLLLGFKLWLALGVFAIVWLGIAAATRYSSLAGLLASAAMPVVLWWQGDGREALLFLVLAAMVWLKHRANIARLLDGTESKIGRSGAASAH
jgi:acyl phosphate:glycerol-3-phosphate acyltransferase